MPQTALQSSCRLRTTRGLYLHWRTYRYQLCARFCTVADAGEGEGRVIAAHSDRLLRNDTSGRS